MGRLHSAVRKLGRGRAAMNAPMQMGGAVQSCRHLRSASGRFGLRAVGVCPLVVSCYRWFEQRTIFQAGKPEKNNHSFWGGTSQIITQKPYSKQEGK